MEGLLVVERVSKAFSRNVTMLDRILRSSKTRALAAVTSVSFSMHSGDMVGLVGESGCGKSTLGKMIAGILEPTAGTIHLDGQPIMQNGRKITTRIQTIFQDPFASLDARMRIGGIIAEGPLVHGRLKRSSTKNFIKRWLEMVGLDPSFAQRYPHQFSGGQRQRIAIARALAMRPDILICDEPVASLDVSIQAQIINLFLQLKDELNLTILFISHDLSVVRHLCERVMVMYLGRIVESGPTLDVYERPLHPYSKALIDAIPKIECGNFDVKPIAGEIPSPFDPPTGCAFHNRCPYAVERCRNEIPLLRDFSHGRAAACHRVSELSLEDAKNS